MTVQHRPRKTLVEPNARRVPHSDVFVFFSNRLGCLGSLAVSLVATIVLVLILAALSSAR